MFINTVQHVRTGGYLLNGALSVPEDAGNRHYRLVQEWIAEGNTPDPATPEPDYEPSALEIDIEALVQAVGLSEIDRDSARTRLKSRRNS